jgi:hypothetical protein
MVRIQRLAESCCLSHRATQVPSACQTAFQDEALGRSPKARHLNKLALEVRTIDLVE